MSEKRKSTAPGAIQVTNWWKAIGTEEELDAISQLKKGEWSATYTVMLGLLIVAYWVCDNAGRKHSIWKENICVARLPQSYRIEP